jgi:large subunit ribosomal protein L4
MTISTLKVDLPAEIFDVQTNVPLIHQVVVGQLAAARQGTHSTKTRADVRGGGRKPYKQKGTGRARQGSTRAPQFAGGGIVHGPQPRDYTQRTPKKMKAAALRGALSDRARHDRIHVVESIATGDAPSAKAAAALLAGLSDRRNVLVVLDRTDLVSMKSVRNLADVHVLAVDQLNTYDVLCADDVLFTKAAYETFTGLEVAVDAKAEKPAKAAKTAELTLDDSATDAPVAAPAAVVDLPKGAVAALEDGSAPEGYTVKGNADSGLYHEPDGQWYEQTVAEVWFKTAKAAEKAGFTKAGSAKKSEDEK